MASATIGVGGVLGHYRIVERLGEGGMGIVYRAHDLRLDRDVALKFLSGGIQDEISRKRLHHEAKLLAKLNHPNIATIYDFDSRDGIDFLVTEYIPGETLSVKLASGPLPEQEVLRLGLQLAEGLAFAHKAGVLHRDLKPSNLQLTPDGRLKILDFGLAQLCRPTSIETTQSVLDLPMAGTLPYQAPEQLHSRPASIQTDIYSAGAALYEMATGRKAFGAGDPVQLIQQITNESPKPPSAINSLISPNLETIILKCLSRDPGNRYQSADELGVDLRKLFPPGSTTTIITVQPQSTKWRNAVIAALALALIVVAVVRGPALRNLLSGSKPPQIQSLAVLPLENLSHDADQDYFADGMTEELITDLAQIRALRVISRTSVMTYKGSKKSLPEIARELNVDAVVEGSVERFKDRVRINAQLIQAKTDRHLWGRSYDEKLSDVLTMQESVARAIADEIQIKLTAQELRNLSTARTVNPAAHEKYLLGRYYWNQGTQQSLTKSIDFLEQAVHIDRQYALAYAALSDSYHLLPDVEGSPPGGSFQKARAAALKALELDPSLAEAHAAMARVKEDYDWDWNGAEQEYKQAIELNPGLGNIHAQYSNLLAETGRIGEAIPEATLALRLDPLSAFTNSNLASMLYFAGDYDKAIEQSRKTLELDPANTRALRNLGRIYIAQGNYESAVSMFQRAIDLSPAPEYLAEMGYAYARWGRKSEAAELLKKLDDSRSLGNASDYQLAVLYVGMGEEKEALRLLDKAVDERAAGINQLKVTHLFDGFRSLPSFQKIINRVGL